MHSTFLELHQNQILWALGIFVLSLVISSLACIFVILRLPETYFHSERPPLEQIRPQWRRTLGTFVKNLVGVALVILGLVMALPGIPGQGLLTMFIGVVLLDFPGKRALERRIISRPSILHMCNRLRARFGKKPFTLVRTENDKALPGKTNSDRVLEDVQGRTK